MPRYLRPRVTPLVCHGNGHFNTFVERKTAILLTPFVLRVFGGFGRLDWFVFEDLEVNVIFLLEMEASVHTHVASRKCIETLFIFSFTNVSYLKRRPD